MVIDPNATGREHAADALRILAEHHSIKVEIAKEGGIQPLVALVSDGSPISKTAAAAALTAVVQARRQTSTFYLSINRPLPTITTYF